MAGDLHSGEKAVDADWVLVDISWPENFGMPVSDRRDAVPINSSWHSAFDIHVGFVDTIPISPNLPHIDSNMKPTRLPLRITVLDATGPLRRENGQRSGTVRVKALDWITNTLWGRVGLADSFHWNNGPAVPVDKTVTFIATPEQQWGHGVIGGRVLPEVAVLRIDRERVQIPNRGWMEFGATLVDSLD